jgi:hypothetical protein
MRKVSFSSYRIQFKFILSLFMQSRELPNSLEMSRGRGTGKATKRVKVRASVLG